MTGNFVKISFCVTVPNRRKATGSYRTYSSLVKLQAWFLSLRWKNCSPDSCASSEGSALGQNTDGDDNVPNQLQIEDYPILTIRSWIFGRDYGYSEIFGLVKRIWSSGLVSPLGGLVLGHYDNTAQWLMTGGLFVGDWLGGHGTVGIHYIAF